MEEMTKENLPDRFKKLIDEMTDKVFSEAQNNYQKWKVINGKPKHTKMSRKRRPISHIDYRNLDRDNIHYQLECMIVDSFNVTRKLTMTALRPMHSIDQVTFTVDPQHPFTPEIEITLSTEESTNNV